MICRLLMCYQTIISSCYNGVIKRAFPTLGTSGTAIRFENDGDDKAEIKILRYKQLYNLSAGLVADERTGMRL